jgi:hypothetical protein
VQVAEYGLECPQSDSNLHCADFKSREACTRLFARVPQLCSKRELSRSYSPPLFTSVRRHPGLVTPHL